MLSLIVVLFYGVANTRAQRGDIRDNGAFFSDPAKAEAGRQIAEIGARFKREVVIETFQSVPDDLKQGVNLQDRAAQNRLFEQWALRQARQLKVNGVYILISKEPAHGFRKSARMSSGVGDTNGIAREQRRQRGLDEPQAAAKLREQNLAARRRPASRKISPALCRAGFGLLSRQR